MSEFKIEKGVEMSNPLGREAGGRSKYGFHEMEVGDSFSFDGSLYRRVGQAAINYGKQHGLKFSVRTFPDGSCRIWRVE